MRLSAGFLFLITLVGFVATVRADEDYPPHTRRSSYPMEKWIFLGPTVNLFNGPTSTGYGYGLMADFCAPLEGVSIDLRYSRDHIGAVGGYGVALHSLGAAFRLFDHWTLNDHESDISGISAGAGFGAFYGFGQNFGANQADAKTLKLIGGVPELSVNPFLRYVWEAQASGWGLLAEVELQMRIRALNTDASVAIHGSSLLYVSPAIHLGVIF